jgi:hypothetical protein
MYLFKSAPFIQTKPSIYSRNHAKFYCRVASTAFYDDDEDELRSRNKKKPNNQHIQHIQKLNKLFYMDYKLTQPELEDLILGTFKRFYKVSLETHPFQECLVIHPEIKSKNDFEYIKELIKISDTLTQYGLKQYVVHQFKHLTMKKEKIRIPLPIDPIHRDM